jgi:hypothetical protein
MCLLVLSSAGQVSNNPSKAEEYLRRAEEIDESSQVTGHSKGDAGRLVLMGPSDATEIGHRESVGISLLCTTVVGYRCYRSSSATAGHGATQSERCTRYVNDTSIRLH